MDIVQAVRDALNVGSPICHNCHVCNHGEVPALGYAVEPEWVKSHGKDRFFYCGACLGKYGKKFFLLDGTPYVPPWKKG